MRIHSPRVEPETYFVSPTPYVPNSRLPIIVYRNALSDCSPEGVVAAIEPNEWIRGGQWKAYFTAHFHSITHECYGVIRGASTFSLGKSPLDAEFDVDGKRNGIKVRFQKGDVFVLPAGIGHCSIDNDDDFEYVGLYPKTDKTKDEFEEAFDMNFCKDSPQKTRELALQAEAVPIPPLDPLYGIDGPLPRLWKAAQAWFPSKI